MLTRRPFLPLTNIDRTFDELWEVMFHSFPSETKPPLALETYGDNSEDGGVLIQMAVAGFQDSDIRVYTQNGVLYLEGDNTQREEVPEKFRSKFIRTLPSKNNIDLDKTKVDLTHGILTVKVPFIQPESNRTYLFGDSS